MVLIDALRRQDIENRYSDMLKARPAARLTPLLAIAAILAYGLYAVWFFELPRLMAEAHWERLGIYLRQWVSYDVQPEFRIKDDGISVRYPRFSVLGDDPHPAWVVNQPDGSVHVDVGANSVDISKAGTTINAHGESVRIDVTSGKPVIAGPKPDWVTLYDEDVTADLGFSGDVSLSVDRVKVRQRFFGWPNFLFDTDSPYFGKSAGEVISLITSGARIDPEQSNLSLAFDNVWNNATWQHGDVWIKLAQTVVMAFLGTLLAALVTFPLAFMAARNITPSQTMSFALKRFFDFLRSMDLLIWSLFMTRAFGPGPLAGAGAIFLTEVGMLGKIYSEGLENVDNKPREGIKSTGASTLLTHRYGTVPQVAPVMMGQTLYQWESNVREATVIGAVGAGGIGLKLWEAMRTNANWANVAYMVILLLIVTFLFDAASAKLRARLIGASGRSGN